MDTCGYRPRCESVEAESVANLLSSHFCSAVVSGAFVAERALKGSFPTPNTGENRQWRKTVLPALDTRVQMDILFANAGGGEFAALGEITEVHFDQTFNTNVKGTLFTVQKALPLLRDGGSIILTGSTTSVTGIPAFSVYSATRSAIRSFARGWMMDLKERKIRVNVLTPGPTNTPGLQQLGRDEEKRKHLLAELVTIIPLGRLGDPDELAQAAVFLASDESSFINGIELFVDGGQAQI